MICLLALASTPVLQAPPVKNPLPKVEPSKNQDPGEKQFREWFGFESMTPAQKTQLLKRVLFTREDFLKSEQAASYHQTLYRFFKAPDYKNLRGNPIIGYFYVEPGFRWMPDQTTVEYIGFTGVNAAKIINPKAYRVAFEAVCRKMGLTIGPSPIKVSGCFVSLYVGQAREASGVVLEMKVQTPNGAVNYRTAIGKKTVGDSIGASMDCVTHFARSYRDGSAKRPPRGLGLSEHKSGK